jgi:hypothetical protein
LEPRHPERHPGSTTARGQKDTRKPATQATKSRSRNVEASSRVLSRA